VRVFQPGYLVLRTEKEQHRDDQQPAPGPIPGFRMGQSLLVPLVGQRGRCGGGAWYRDVRAVAERQAFASHRHTLRLRNAASSAATAA
jgi:hypothetical protein